jgi:hypothetical protein
VTEQVGAAQEAALRTGEKWLYCVLTERVRNCALLLMVMVVGACDAYCE